MLTGSRINASVVTPVHGLFLTCRGEKCKQYCIVITADSMYMRDLECENPLLRMLALVQGASLIPLSTYLKK
jgi:hypothetical protein